jgi:hypothetical protein
VFTDGDGAERDGLREVGGAVDGVHDPQPVRRAGVAQQFVQRLRACLRTRRYTLLPLSPTMAWELDAPRMHIEASAWSSAPRSGGANGAEKLKRRRMEPIYAKQGGSIEASV